MGRRRPDLPDLVVGAAMLAFAAALTWPWAVHPRSTVAAPVGYDVSGSIAKFAALAREDASPFASGRLHSIAWPDGVVRTPGLDGVSVLHSGTVWLMSEAVGAIPAHGVVTLLGPVLTGTGAYLLVRWVTGSAPAGVVAGAAFAAFPHLVLTLRAAPAYSHGWLLLLPLAAATRLALAPTRRSAVLAGAAALPAMFWTPYYTLHVLALALACGCVVAVLVLPRAGGRGTLALLGAAAAPIAGGVAAYVAVGLATSFRDAPSRAAEDAYLQSAHPLMYLVPGNIAWLWGPDPQRTLAEAVPRVAGTNLYLGVSVLVLAVLGAGNAVRGLRAWWPARTGSSPPPAAAAGGIALASAATAFVLSLPPGVGLLGLDVPLPSRLVVDVVPGLRAGQRFVVPLMAAVCVLAGLGAARLVAGMTPRRAAAAGAALAVVVVADLAVDPARRTARIPASPALAALRDAPDGAVIHYQSTRDGTTLLVGAIARPCVLQIAYGKPLVNGCNQIVDESTRARLVSLDYPADCRVAARLRALGVRYVVADAGVDAFPSCPGVATLARDGRFTVRVLPA